MRIVHITPTAVGAPWLVALAREQEERGHDVTLLIPSLDGTIAAALQGSGVECIAASVDILSGTGLIDRARRLAKLVRLLRRIRPDVVHSHIINAVATGRLASWLADVPIRIAVNAGPLTLESELLRLFELGTAFCDTTFVASCGYTFELLERCGIENRELIFYAADERRFDPARADGARVRRELGVDADIPLVGLVAYFYPLATNPAVFPPHLLGRGVKGHEVLLNAFARVLTEEPKAKLALVGRGWGPEGDVYASRMKKLARALGIDHAVLFTGERSDVEDVLAAFDVSVHPSLSDNLGGTLESLLMARPMVVSDIPGYRDTVVPDETGLVVPVSDDKALAAAIVRLIRDKNLARRLGENGRRHMLERFTLQRCADDVDALMTRSAARVEGRYRISKMIGRSLALPWRLLPMFKEVRRVMRRHRVSKKIRVAQVAGAWANCDWFVDLCRDLAARDYDVVAVIDARSGDLSTRLAAAGIPHHKMRMTFATNFDRLRLPFYLINIPIAALRLARILRRERIDIVHSHIFTSVVIARLAAFLARARHVAGIAGPRHLEAATTRVIDRLTWALDDVTVAGCRHTRGLYAKLGRDEQHLDCIYYGADETRFAPTRANPAAARAALGIDADTPLIAMIANFYPPTRGPQTPPNQLGRGLKGHEDLLAAARKIPHAHFVVAGSALTAQGEEYRQRLIDGAPPNVIFTGHCDDVPSLLAAADVAVQCSLTENLGGTIEALLMETPVVATRVGGMPEAVRDGETGLLVPPSDPDALAAAILRLLENREEARTFGGNGRRLMLERFTATRTADDVDRLYRRMRQSGAGSTASERASA